MTHHLLRLLAVTSLLAGCTEPESPEPLASTDPVPDESEFYETVVEQMADGTMRVSEPRMVTAGEQRAQNEFRAAIERGETAPPQNYTSVDGGCSFDSLWLYSRIDWTGARICFSGKGHIFLDTLFIWARTGGRPVPIGTWSIYSGSYVPGNEAGELEDEFVNGQRAWWFEWDANGPRGAFDHATRAHTLFLTFN